MTTDVREKKEKKDRSHPGWGATKHYRWEGEDTYLCGKKRVNPKPSKAEDVPCPICYSIVADLTRGL